MVAPLWNFLRRLEHQEWPHSPVVSLVLPHSKDLDRDWSHCQQVILFLVDSVPDSDYTGAGLHSVQKGLHDAFTDQVRVFQRGVPHSGLLHYLCLLSLGARP